MAKQKQVQTASNNLENDDRAAFIQSMLRAGYRFQSDNDNTMIFIEVSTGNEVQVRH